MRGENTYMRLKRVEGEGVAGAYGSWLAMRARTRHPERKKNRCYAGISICARWNSFAEFLSDMGERPEGKTLDRIDRSMGYQPDNCRWADAIQQARNRGCVKLSASTATAIRSRYAKGGISQDALGHEHGVSQVLIGKIVRNECWN